MMKFLIFLTSRGFAIFLLAVSIGFLVFWNVYGFYSPVFSIIPLFSFLSIALCLTKRIAAVAPTPRGAGRAGWNVKFSGSVIFHIGLLMIIAVVSLQPFVGFWATIVLPQGITVNTLGEDFVSIHSTPLVGEAPFIALRLDWQKKRYEDGLFPVDYAAGVRIVFMENNSLKGENTIIRINDPVWINGYQFLYNSGDLSPLFVLTGKNGTILHSQYAEVDNNTDKEDVIDIPAAGMSIYTRFFPDMFKEGGKYGTRSKNPDNPAFGIRLASKSEPFKDIWKGVLKPGEKAEFEGMTLELADLKPVVVLQIVKDPTYWGIYAGWLLIVAGLVIRYVPLLTGKKDAK